MLETQYVSGFKLEHTPKNQLCHSHVFVRRSVARRASPVQENVETAFHERRRCQDTQKEEPADLKRVRIPCERTGDCLIDPPKEEAQQGEIAGRLRATKGCHKELRCRRSQHDKGEKIEEEEKATFVCVVCSISILCGRQSSARPYLCTP